MSEEHRDNETNDEQGQADESEPIALEEDEPRRTPDTDRPAARRHRAADDDDAERVLCVVRAAMFRAHPLRYLAIIIMFLGGIALGVAALLADPETSSIKRWMLWPGLIITAAAGIWFCIWWFDTHLSHKLTVTNKRTIQRIGFFSRNTSEVLHEHIRNIRIDQNLVQRAFKVGRLRIDSAAGGGGADDEVEIEMYDVPTPHELKALIDPYRQM